MDIETVKVVSTDPKNQGPYVLVNKSDYDANPKAYGKLYEPAPPKKLTAAEQKKLDAEEAERKAKEDAEAKAKAEADEAERKRLEEEAAKTGGNPPTGWNQ